MVPRVPIRQPDDGVRAAGLEGNYDISVMMTPRPKEATKPNGLLMNNRSPHLEHKVLMLGTQVGGMWLNISFNGLHH